MTTVKKYSRIKHLVVMFFLTAIILSAGCGAGKKQPEGQTNYDEGMALFQEGFYDLMPRGKLDEANRKFEQAEKAFRQAVFLNKNSVEFRRQLARVLVLRQNYSAAADEFQKTIELEPGNIDNYLILSSVYTRMKRYGDARKTLEHAKTLSKDTDTVEMINNLIKEIRAKEPN
jgi:tetratricopeptide (TPR) repeat protein